ncbi:MAG TPA: hypothetical protein VJR47_17105 [Stellaceae bacterium]|nr:hypothetical protein [Stellaceae bacterium]
MPTKPDKETGAALSMPARTYEVQRLSQGRWIVDSVSDEKEMALMLAKSLANGKRGQGGVRVMSVMATERGKFSEISVWRSGQPEPVREAAPAPKAPPEAPAATVNQTGDFKHTGGHPAPPSETSPLRNVVYALQAAFGLGVSLAAAEAVYLLMR